MVQQTEYNEYAAKYEDLEEPVHAPRPIWQETVYEIGIALLMVGLIVWTIW